MRQDGHRKHNYKNLTKRPQRILTNLSVREGRSSGELGLPQGLFMLEASSELPDYWTGYTLAVEIV